MNILFYLETLLKDRKQVSFKGLGTFFKSKDPGRYDVEQQSYLPPKYYLQFTEEFEENNELATAISEKENISVEEANELIEQSAANLKEQLATGDEVILPNIGKLNAQNGVISFITDENIDLGKEFFGFPIVKDISAITENIETVENVVEEENIDSETEVEEVRNIEEPYKTEDSLNPATTAFENNVESTQEEHIEDSEATTNDEILIEQVEEEHIEAASEPHTEEQEETVHIPKNKAFYDPEIPTATVPPNAESQQLNWLENQPGDEEDEAENQKSWLLKILAIIAIIVAIITVAFLIRPSLYTDLFGSKEETSIVADTTLGKDLLTNATDTITTDSALAQKINTIVAGSATTNSTLTQPLAEDSYEIVVAAVKGEDVINSLITNYNKLGFKAKIIPGRNLQKISVASFATQKEASDSLRSVKKKLKNNDIYIFHNKTK